MGMVQDEERERHAELIRMEARLLALEAEVVKLQHEALADPRSSRGPSPAPRPRHLITTGHPLAPGKQGQAHMEQSQQGLKGSDVLVITTPAAAPVVSTQHASLLAQLSPAGHPGITRSGTVPDAGYLSGSDCPPLPTASRVMSCTTPPPPPSCS